MEILENREEWKARFEEWWANYQRTGTPDWKAYPLPRNSTAPSGPGVDLSQSRLLFISSAGGYLRDEQPPFDAAHPLGDYSLRLFPVDTPLERLAFSHDHYDHAAVEQDPQVLVPLRHLEAMVDEGIIGALAPTVVGFMGYLPDVTRLVDELIPAVLEAVRAKAPDAVLLVPA